MTYLYLTFGDGRLTVAISEIENIAEIGVAFCSPYDQFSKEIGRKIATERLLTKKDFYVAFARDNSKLKWQVREIVKYIVSGEWVTKDDIENELETKIFKIVTETETDIPNDIAPMTVYTNTVPSWAKQAVVEKNLY